MNQLFTSGGPSIGKKKKKVNPIRNQCGVFIGRTDAEAEAPKLLPPELKIRLIGRDSEAGKDSWQAEKGVIEDEMVEWHHQLNGHKFEKIPGDSEGEGGLACFNPGWHKQWGTTAPKRFSK